MESCDFIMSIMFMKNIVSNTKQMTEALQGEDHNIVDAMTIICSTVCGLQRINGNSLAIDDLIEAGFQYTDKLGGNAHAEFNCEKIGLDGDQQEKMNIQKQKLS